MAKPKATPAHTPMPTPEETQTDFMDRCVTLGTGLGGDKTEVTRECQMMWDMTEAGDMEGSDPSMPGGMGYAYSVLNIKSMNDEARVIEGVASTPTADRVGDVVVPTGAKFALPMPLLWQHDAKAPIGHVTYAKATDDGIPFRAKLVRVDEPGRLKDRLDEAWQSLKHGLVRSVSIGFRDLESEPLDPKKGWGSGIKFNKWEWLELSAVTIPANQDCTINVIRSIDRKLRGTDTAAEIASEQKAASGEKPAITIAGDTAKRSFKLKGPTMAKKTIQDRIADLEASRAAASAAVTAISEKVNDEGRTKDEAEQQEFDDLMSKIESVDRELTDQRKMERLSVQQARAVQETQSQTLTVQSTRSPVQVTTKPNRPPGIGFARMAIAKMAAFKQQTSCEAICQQYWPSDDELLSHFKTAVATGTSTTSGWASQLVVATNMASEFVDFLRPMTIIGRVPGFRRVPFNITVPRQTAGVAGQWVGEGKAKPIGKPTFDQITLRFAKASIISVFNEELARFSNPSVETLVRDDLAAGISQFLDEQFFDPANTAVTNVHPGAITESADTQVASDPTIAGLDGDILAAYANFESVEIPLDGVVVVMQPSLASQIARMRNPLGQPAFPGIDQNGGMLAGAPVYTSTNVGSGRVVWFKPSEILLADDGQANVDVSNQASLQMDDSPTAGAQSLMSLYQTNRIAVRAERFITWAVRRDDAVYYVTSANYGVNGTA